MKLVTIWSIHYMPFTERIRRTIDWGAFTAARKLPKRVKYWSTMQELGKIGHIFPDKEILSIPIETVIKNLDGGPR